MDSQARRLEPVEVPVLRLGDRVFFMTLMGEPDPEYGHVFSADEAERWAERHAALLTLADLLEHARGSNLAGAGCWQAGTRVGGLRAVGGASVSGKPAGGASTALPEAKPHQMRLPLPAR
ncbi:hypothetical protein [Tepidiforma thermophila]|uniref:hypothetical protein n=1 Tax=Tepidiforma thermophila (strain KCTC 52669 / CGMCC 1.13589 / G233) TaxID=2761530 RepID=UPI000BF25EE8|nr:hypothetical protein [Tepidiforma thermophila]